MEETAEAQNVTGTSAGPAPIQPVGDAPGATVAELAPTTEPLPAPPTPKPAKPTVWPAFLTYAVAMAANIVAAVIAVVAYMIVKGDMKPTMSAGLLLTVLPLGSLALAGTALLAAALFRPGVRQGLRLRASGVGLGTYGIMILGTMALSLTTGVLMSLLGLQNRGALKDLEDALRQFTLAGLAVTGLMLSFGPGIAEELLMRGFVQRRLSARWGPATGIIVAAILFGVMHLDLVQGIAVVGLGLYCGYVCERTKSIWPAIVCHIANNLLAVLMVALEKAGADASLGMMLGLLAIALAVLVVCLRYLSRNLPVGTESAAGAPVAQVSVPHPPGFEASAVTARMD